MRTLAIDIETFSSADLTKTGVYKYVEAPDFTILLFAYCFEDGIVHIIDLANGEELPEKISSSLNNMFCLKTAHNANFERTCIAKHFGISLPPSQWECTMAKASMLSLPLGLDAVSKALKLENGKDASGKSLIRYFSVPCKPTKTNGNRTRNLPEHSPEKWQQFKDYCVQDVVTEQTVRDKISFFDIPDTEKKLWNLDQRINDRGVLLDHSFVKNAIQFNITTTDKLVNEAVQLSGLDNPNSVSQLKAWISEETGEEVKTLNKETVPVLLKQSSCEIVTRVLQIRQEMSKTSIKKYVAMHKAVCADKRVRGLLQFYGANRTGRWAGRLVQVQNLPQNHLLDLDLARTLVKQGELELLEMLFGNVPDTLSQLIRTSFIAQPGHRFIIADFSAIEARIIAWLAGEAWKMEVFKTHGKIYEAAGAHMFKVPIEQVTKGSELRHKAKIAELALGYQGGPNALIKMGALQKGLTEDELPKLVSMWRNANKKIVEYWNTIDDVVYNVIDEPSSGRVLPHGIKVFIEKGVLFIQLPSGRRLSYLRPRLKQSQYSAPSITYEGMSQTTKQWTRQDTYGGKLVENIVQGTARDVLADAMLRLDDAGYKIIMHVHDEIVMEMPEGKGSIEEVNKIMGQAIPWADGLPLRAESTESIYYRKD